VQNLRQRPYRLGVTEDWAGDQKKGYKKMGNDLCALAIKITLEYEQGLQRRESLLRLLDDMSTRIETTKRLLSDAEKSIRALSETKI
jgi:hypothetical protein